MTKFYLVLGRANQNTLYLSAHLFLHVSLIPLLLPSPLYLSVCISLSVSLFLPLLLFHSPSVICILLTCYCKVGRYWFPVLKKLREYRHWAFFWRLMKVKRRQERTHPVQYCQDGEMLRALKGFHDFFFTLWWHQNHSFSLLDSTDWLHSYIRLPSQWAWGKTNIKFLFYHNKIEKLILIELFWTTVKIRMFCKGVAWFDLGSWFFDLSLLWRFCWKEISDIFR